LRLNERRNMEKAIHIETDASDLYWSGKNNFIE